jgi:hypothetical protein
MEARRRWCGKQQQDGQYRWLSKQIWQASQLDLYDRLVLIFVQAYFFLFSGSFLRLFVITSLKMALQHRRIEARHEA